VKNLYDFVAVLDFDEVIFPVNDDDMTWEDMIRRLNTTEVKDTYTLQNFYYPNVEQKLVDGVPSYMYILQHVQRLKKNSEAGAACKSLFNTETVLAVHNHFPYYCLSEQKNCILQVVPLEVGHLNHYRYKGNENNETMVEDTSIWKFKDQLMKAVHETMKATKFRA
jgi:hypothetical protein